MVAAWKAVASKERLCELKAHSPRFFPSTGRHCDASVNSSTPRSLVSVWELLCRECEQNRYKHPRDISSSSGFELRES